MGGVVMLYAILKLCELRTFHVRPFVSVTANEDSACVCGVRAGAPVFLEPFQRALGRGSLQSQRQGDACMRKLCPEEVEFRTLLPALQKYRPCTSRVLERHEVQVGAVECRVGVKGANLHVWGPLWSLD
jgi:hypothetical protein